MGGAEEERPMTLEIAPIPRDALPGHLADLARLRIAVFRDFPYLYDGDMAYEERYLATLAASAEAVVVGAWDGGILVGAATGAPMEDHADEFAAAFAGTGHDLPDIFYCAESVLLPEYRGQGAGHAFFDHREAAARRLGRRHSAFCAVVRPADHPARPAGYRPLDTFWRKRGYRPLPGVVAEYSWRDVGDAEETAKPLQFWIRAL
jgi:GNAT superfamily N-acetyltransferase